MFNAIGYGQYAYANWISEDQRADKCLECGECEAQCPQHIAIMEWLKKANRELTAA